jgi:Domain of unknown function (DUF4157)
LTVLDASHKPKNESAQRPAPKARAEPPPAAEHVLLQLLAAGPAAAQAAEAPSGDGIGPPDAATTPAPFGLLVDDGAPVRANQIRRSEFIDTIGREIERVVNEELASTGRSARDCPYLAKWLRYYRNRSAVQVERAIAIYAQPNRTDLEGIYAAVLARVRVSVQAWVRSGGRDIQIPDGAAPEPPSGGSPVQLLAQTGASAGPTTDPARVRAQLGAGQPLEGGVRSRMEGAFGQNFGTVRVHTDAHASRLATSLSARAFAVGSDVAFAASEYRPGSLTGDLVLAHELAHVIAQRHGVSGSAEALEADADRAAVRAVAPGVEAGPLLDRLRRGTTAPAARESGGLRLQRCSMFAERDERTIEQVRADLEASGELGRRTDLRPLPADYAPADLSGTPLSAADRAALSATPQVLSPAAIALDLDQILAQLEQLEPLLTSRPTGVAALTQARAQVAAARATIGTGDPAELSRRVLRTRVVLEQTRRALSQLAIARPRLTGPEAMHHVGYEGVLDRVTALFDGAVGRAAQGDVLERFQEADRAAADLPQALLRADLAAFGSLRAGAEMLQPSIREIHAWASRITPRLAALQEHARQLAEARTAHASDLQTREARFRDESDGIALAIEALAYWEQLARGYAYLAGNPPYDVNAIDGIARLMTRVRRMRDADDRGDVALLHALVVGYRTDEDVQRFINNLGIFVTFSRFAVSLGIVLAAAMASAGIGAGATAAIGTTTTTAGTVSAFVGVTALEALTFTAVSRSLQSVLPGQQTQGSFIGELAWNFGLFSVLKFANLGVAAATRFVAVPAFTRLVSHAVSYPLLLGYGAIHQRVTTGEWPTPDEFDRMGTEILVLMAGFAVVARRSSPGTMPRELQVFRARYGLQFETLGAGRQALADQLLNASRSPTTPDAVTADTTRRARILEDNLRSLLDTIRADPNIRLPELRAALRGLGIGTEVFALQIRLTEAGLGPNELATVEARVAALPEPVRESTASQLRAATEYATTIVGDVGTRRAALATVTRVGTNPRIGGFGEWVRFSTAQRPGVVPAEQVRNFLDDVGELQVAEAMSQSVGPRQRVEVGGDARAQLRPGTADQFLPSFDIRVVGAPQARQVEVYSPDTSTPQIGDFGRAINHAADKIIADPALPASYRTTGIVEAAIRIPWPVPDRATGGGTIETARNGNVTLVQGNGVRRPMGNLFDDYVPILNGERRGQPAGANRVNVLTVYDRAGNMLYRYTRTAGRWTGIAL